MFPLRLRFLEVVLVALTAVILVAVAVLVIDPVGQLKTARDAQRRADLAVIVEAIAGFTRDNGRLPATLPGKPTPVCRSGVNVDCRGLIDLNVLTGAYLPAIPADPLAGTAISTGYAVRWDGAVLTLEAPFAESGQAIAVMRTLGGNP